MASPAYCDLHMHSTASDGDDAPEALAALVREAGLDAFALTDHDTAVGIPAAAAAAERLGLAFVPGIELSADPTGDEVCPAPAHGEHPGTLHILGYFIQHDDAALNETQHWLRLAREQRNRQIVARLNALGVKIEYGQIEQLAGGDIVGRPHIAQAMMRRGYVKSIHEAFARYIGHGGAAHVPKQRLSPARAIEAIHHADGLAVLAHPVQLQLDAPAQFAAAVARLVNLGLDGIETRHSDHRPEDTARFEQIAERHGLLATGGSDYHGPMHAARLGRPRVAWAVYESLCAAHRRVAGKT